MPADASHRRTVPLPPTLATAPGPTNRPARPSFVPLHAGEQPPAPGVDPDGVVAAAHDEALAVGRPRDVGGACHGRREGDGVPFAEGEDVEAVVPATASREPSGLTARAHGEPSTLTGVGEDEPALQRGGSRPPPP